MYFGDVWPSERIPECWAICDTVPCVVVCARVVKILRGHANLLELGRNGIRVHHVGNRASEWLIRDVNIIDLRKGKSAAVEHQQQADTYAPAKPDTGFAEQ